MRRMPLERAAVHADDDESIIDLPLEEMDLLDLCNSMQLYAGGTGNQAYTIRLETPPYCRAHFLVRFTDARILARFLSQMLYT